MSTCTRDVAQFEFRQVAGRKGPRKSSYRDALLHEVCYYHRLIRATFS